MIYATTSMKEVIARVARNTRLTDASFLTDMPEWIPEAMGYMKTKMTLEKVWKDLRIQYHRAKLPCGIQSVSAIQYGCHRLRYYNGARAAGSAERWNGDAASVYPGIPLEGTTIFGTHLVKRPAVDDGVEVAFYETSLERVSCLSEGEHWYYTENGSISTSFSDGIIRVHYRRLPLDGEGYPMIPDDELYKEALYYYVLAKMIIAGYETKAISEREAMLRFEDYAARAMSRIRYPSVDQAEEQVRNLSRLILPENMWENFGHVPSEPFYNDTDDL